MAWKRQMLRRCPPGACPYLRANRRIEQYAAPPMRHPMRHRLQVQAIPQATTRMSLWNEQQAVVASMRCGVIDPLYPRDASPPGPASTPPASG